MTHPLSRMCHLLFLFADTCKNVYTASAVRFIIADTAAERTCANHVKEPTVSFLFHWHDRRPDRQRNVHRNTRIRRARQCNRTVVSANDMFDNCHPQP